MNVKKYRAATMRDALEQVKSELGDEALVLGSKSLKRKGFFGFGAREMVEVQVSTEFANSNGPAKQDAARIRKPTFTSLSLHPTQSPNSPASPNRETRNTAGFSALAARAYASEVRPSSAPTLPVETLVEPNTRAFETLTTRAKEETVVKPSAVATETNNVEKVETPATVTKRDSLMAELERLRAEVREVKFTLTSNLRRDVLNNSRSPKGLNDLDGEIYDSPYYETYLYLANIGLSPEIARSAVRAAIASGAETRNIHNLARIGLVKTLPSMILFGDDPLAPRSASPANQNAVALVGPTGVGKTTTIAKLAARLALRERKRVELITLDTYRIAAVEQLRTYAEIIGAGFHVPRSVLELNALVERFSGQATVLIDTIGRSARDLADQMELADYLRNSEQIVKCLAVQATTHPTDATLAIEKFSLFGINELVITKLDETGRSGSAISTVAAARLPLAYLCSGQRVPEDIERATAESLADHALQTKTRAMAA
jgi:flagellar biosynthesis protein FlhF